MQRYSYLLRAPQPFVAPPTSVGDERKVCKQIYSDYQYAVACRKCVVYCQALGIPDTGSGFTTVFWEHFSGGSWKAVCNILHKFTAFFIFHILVERTRSINQTFSSTISNSLHLLQDLPFHMIGLCNDLCQSFWKVFMFFFLGH